MATVAGRELVRDGAMDLGGGGVGWRLAVAAGSGLAGVGGFGAWRRRQAGLGASVGFGAWPWRHGVILVVVASSGPDRGGGRGLVVSAGRACRRRRVAAWRWKRD